MAKKRVTEDNIIEMGGSAELEEMNEASRARYSQVRTGFIVLIFLAIIIAGVVLYVHFSMEEFKGYKVLYSAETVF